MRYGRMEPVVAEGGVENDEKRLLRHLMRGYERDVRPVKNASTPIVIQLSMTLTQIFDMDEKNQVLTTIIWLDQVLTFIANCLCIFSIRQNRSMRN